MSICRLGSACIVSLKGTEPDLRPVAMATTGTNHGCGLVMRQGQSKAWWQAARVCGGSGLLCAGARLTRALRQAQAVVGLRVVVAQARSSDCGGSADGGTGLDSTGRLWQQRSRQGTVVQGKLRARLRGGVKGVEWK